MQSSLYSQQIEILRKIFVKMEVTESTRCLLLADFPPKWAQALSELLEDFFPTYDQECLLAMQCRDYHLHFGTDSAQRRSVILVDAYDSSAGRTFLDLKSILYRFQNKILVVMADAAVGSWNPPNHLGEIKIIRVRDELSETLLSSGLDSSPLVQSIYRDDAALLTHSQKIIPKYGLENLILRESTMQNFMETLNIARNKIKDSYESGWRNIHPRGHNVVLVFNGPSGTGKTMAAEVIAKELGYFLYRIDYSSIQSKFVGEAEKNLKAIFEAARGVPGVLLFDEGDAIFASRTTGSEASSSQSRYANGEVNFLLQELENFEGIIIISTNLEKNMDDAFMRRFTRVVSFPFPTQEVRTYLWKKLGSPKMQFEGDIDFSILGTLYLSGGDIRNALVEANLIPRARGERAVTMVDLLWAAKRECQKKGLGFPPSNTATIPIELLELVGSENQGEGEIYAAGADPYHSKHIWNQLSGSVLSVGTETASSRERKRADAAYSKKLATLLQEKEELAQMDQEGELSLGERERFHTLRLFLAQKPSPQNRLALP